MSVPENDDEAATTPTSPNQTVITLCGVQGCCPTVTMDRDTGTLVIKDDDGGSVKLTKEQWEIAAASVRF